MKRKVLNNGVVPTLWPGLPSYLSKTPPTQRATKLASSESRSEQCFMKDYLHDIVSDLKDIDEKIPKSRLSDGVHKIVAEGQYISFIKLLWTPIKPKIEYCLNLNPSLDYEVWLSDSQNYLKHIREKGFSFANINLVSSIIKILSTLDEELNEYKHKNIEKLIDNLVDELKDTSLWENAKIKFLSEQNDAGSQTFARSALLARCTSISLYVAKYITRSIYPRTT